MPITTPQALAQGRARCITEPAPLEETLLPEVRIPFLALIRTKQALNLSSRNKTRMVRLVCFLKGITRNRELLLRARLLGESCFRRSRRQFDEAAVGGAASISWSVIVFFEPL